MKRERSSKQVGGKVRPTTQKILESMAAILAPRLEGARVLDLFAGTGSVGLRMVEQGAERVVFVEGHSKVAQDLRGKIRCHPLKAKLSLLVGPIPKVLSKIQGEFDLLLCDPPYDWDEPVSLLPGCSHLVKSGGLLLVEHHHKTIYQLSPGWSLYRCEKYGESRVSFFQRE